MMFETWTTIDFALVAFIGLLAGTLGGMLGVGGSVIMIPGLTMVLGYGQHLYQAAAMAANVAVSIPAALRHKRAGAILPGVLKWMLPASVVFVLVGVALSNLSIFEGQQGGRWLGRMLAAFQVYVIWVNIGRLRKEWTAHQTETRAAANAEKNANSQGSEPGRPSLNANTNDTETLTSNPPPARTLTVGAIMGTIAGLLGIGGGAVAVPLQQTVLKLPLRNAIANSSAVICLSAAIGAVYKNATLAQHGSADAPLSWQTGLALAAVLAPTAWIGGRLGASLTHRLPIRYVRIAFIALMAVAAVKMAM